MRKNVAANQVLPAITVITASLNRGHLIDQAIQSVLRQDYPSLQHIVVDGGSSDDTHERLARYPHLTVVDEPDEGVYDAFNKGLRMATGDIVAFVNSDDLVPDGVFRKVGGAFSALSTAEMVSGSALVFLDGSEGNRVIRSRFREKPAPRLTLENLLWRTPMLNARFIRRHVYEEVGFFDTSWRVESDFDLMIALARRRISCTYLEDVVYLYRQHPDSLSFGLDRSAFLPERLSILDKHFDDPQLRPQDRRILRRWHSWLVANAISIRLLHGGKIPIVDSLRRGTKRDAWFIPRLLGYGLRRAARLDWPRS